MKNDEASIGVPRQYRQGARAEAAAETHRRIAEAVLKFMRERWVDEITLVDVAEAAGVSVQTVIRRFSGKEGLLKAAVELISPQMKPRREAAAPDIRSTLAALIADYEAEGDLVVRILAQETRSPVVKVWLDVGRAEHRRWVERSFDRWLAGLEPALRERRVLELIVITDVYTWQILRRDQGKRAEEVVDIMEEMAGRLLESG
ncbi:TetR/AcrR family transcriptional regulator [Methylococcus mesophilus]|uniref:TetR/AcrR family transcriptional regulator n=1 Tax=Methylococcus mesophilus TaxID=2993564 RepID=UPI00224A80B7|nr:TetR/AcrR family transcriptional regulator [Methylococcus mesophilus]UZR30354.1 TetR/AcrR family transcriptional regulator [Methylococcus mesophilus]